MITIARETFLRVSTYQHTLILPCPEDWEMDDLESLAPYLPWHPDDVTRIEVLPDSWGVRYDDGPWEWYGSESEALASVRIDL